MDVSVTEVVVASDDCQSKEEIIDFSKIDEEDLSKSYIIIKDFPAGTTKQTALEDHALPRQFRSTDKYYHKNITVSLEGLGELNISGSAQYTKLEMKNMIDLIKADKKERSVIIVDLRQESHGFINGETVSWFIPENKLNIGKENTQVELKQQKQLDKALKQKFVTIHSIVEKVKKDLIKTHPSVTEVTSISSEEDEAKKLGVNYRRFYVTDLHPPLDKEVDRFVNFFKGLKGDEWLHFHCKAGKGRTTTFMSMVDILKNHSRNVSLEAILTRQKELGGQDLAGVPDSQQEGLSARQKLTIERKQFIADFYDYVKENASKGFVQSWSEWKN